MPDKKILLCVDTISIENLMGKLTDKKYWDSIYNAKVEEPTKHTLKENLKLQLTKLLEIGYTRTYADYLLWEVIYQKYIPKAKGAKILEVGSAPGNNLVRFSQMFGFIPFGVEYSESGVKLNRKIFTSYNINPDNVIYADFLSEEFQNKYKEYFDIVFSSGFIEHFDNVGDIIEKHINLLTEGGCLIVSIPNLRGANYILQQIFDKELLPKHNLTIMQKKEFLEIFDKNNLSPLFCDYYGTFHFGLFVAKKNSMRSIALNICKCLQIILNVISRILFRSKGAESPLFSPYLLFVGVKKRALNKITPELKTQTKNK